MKIPYASPNLRIVDVVRALFITGNAADKKIKYYFSRLTGKKHILITNSCRSALYLAYMAINPKGQVITSPLTCKVAIEPIIESGNTPVFADINTGDLNIQPDDIELRTTNKTIAIQAIHLGGVSCDMALILSIARKKKLMVIEDCAQSLGAVYKEIPTGSFGDLACFSLIKNAYGIGGGILATDDVEIYNFAQNIISTLDKTPLLLVLFRVVRNILDTKRRYRPFFLLYKFFMALKSDKKGCKSIQDQLRRVSSIEKKIAVGQIDRLGKLHTMRKKVGQRYCELLTKHEIMLNKDFDVHSSSFTKLFVYNPEINSHKLLRRLGDKDIEAMHLEQKYGSPFQNRLVGKEQAKVFNLYNYGKAHDHIISVPLHENLSEKEQIEIVRYMKLKSG